MPSPEEIHAAILQVAEKNVLFSGNCAAFAAVLNRVLGGDGHYLIADSGHYEYADHVAIVFKRKVYDGDGLTTSKAFKERYVDREEGVSVDDFYDDSSNGDDVRKLADAGCLSPFHEERVESALRSLLGVALEETPLPAPGP